MKEHDQVYLKVFMVEVEPENMIMVNYIGNKEDITDKAPQYPLLFNILC